MSLDTLTIKVGGKEYPAVLILQTSRGNFVQQSQFEVYICWSFWFIDVTRNYLALSVYTSWCRYKADRSRISLSALKPSSGTRTPIYPLTCTMKSEPTVFTLTRTRFWIQNCTIWTMTMAF